jgi:hypothetical protein
MLLGQWVHCALLITAVLCYLPASAEALPAGSSMLIQLLGGPDCLSGNAWQDRPIRAGCCVASEALVQSWENKQRGLVARVCSAEI